MILASSISTGIFLFKGLDFIKHKEQNLSWESDYCSKYTALPWLQKKEREREEKQQKPNLILSGEKKINEVKLDCMTN